MDAGDPKATRRGTARGGMSQGPAPERERQFSRAFVSRFQIKGTLGTGGMGSVYLAKDQSLDREVAIKFSNALDADSRARFAREGRVLARLRHPNVIQVYDTGEEDGSPFLVFEVVQGASLADRISQEGPLHPTEALEVGRQVAAGLASAHAEGVLHRDLKSSNILLTDAGEVKICDFGLAREASGADRVTAQGAFLGTPEYLAPEVIEGHEPTAASDIYSLGCVLMEMLTGDPPYPSLGRDGTRRTIAQIVSAHLREESPAPSSRCNDLSPEVDQLVAWCLSKGPRDRPASAAVVEDSLGALSRKESVRSHVRLRAAKDLRARAVKPASEPEAPASTTRAFAVSRSRIVPAARPAAAASGARAFLTGAAVSLGLLAVLIVIARLQMPGDEHIDRVRRIDVPLELHPIGTNLRGYPEFQNKREGSVLIQIPGGRYLRGSEQGEPDERPVRAVDVSPFFLGKTPVTRAQYAKFCKATGYKDALLPDYPAGPEQPVVNVSWGDAAAYCEWAGLRLPTEAEWEFAARGADGRLFPWGNDVPDHGGAARANFRGRVDDGFQYACPVGLFGPGAPLPRADGSSPFGALDMAGNVWQWCQDWHNLRFYANGPTFDPVNQTPAKRRIARGGAFYNSAPKFLRSTYRFAFEPETLNDTLGFRVAR